MSRESFVYRPGLGVLPKAEAPLLVEPGPMSDLACPQVMGDTMAPVQSMADGRLYDSKSALRAHYRQAGVIEVGNDPARHRPRQKPKVDRHALKATVERATARHARGDRA